MSTSFNSTDRKEEEKNYNLDGGASFCLSGSYDCTVKLWETSTGKLLSTTPLDGGHSVRFLIFFIFKYLSFFFSDNNNKPTFLLFPLLLFLSFSSFSSNTQGPILAVDAPARCGRLCLSASQDGTACLWDMQSPGFRLVRKFGDASGTGGGGGATLSGGGSSTFHQGHVKCCTLASFSYGTNLAITGGEDGMVKVWDGRARHGLAMTLRGHQGSVNCIQAGSYILPTIVSGGEDGTVRVWDMRRVSSSSRAFRSSGGSGGSGGSGDSMLVMNDHDGKSIRCLSWNWNKIVTSGDSNFVVVNSIHNGEILFTGMGHSDMVTGVCMDESHFISCSLDSEIRAWFAPAKR